MKNTISIEFEPDKEETFNSSNDLIKRIEDIDNIYQNRETIAVLIEKVNGEVLSMTLGSDQVIIGYYPSDYSETGLGSMHSINNSSMSEKIVTYCHLGHHTEGLKKWCIDKKVAMETLKNFIDNEGCPKSVNWEDD